MKVQWVSPLDVYRAASRGLRWRFWLCVVFCVVVTPGVVIAQAQQPSKLDEWMSPPVIIALASAVITIGSMIQDLREVKKAQVAASAVYARVDVVDVQHKLILAAVQQLRDEVRAIAGRFEGFFPQLNAQINSIERAAHEADKEIVALKKAMELK